MQELKPLAQWSPSFEKRGKVKAPYLDIDKPVTHLTFDQSIEAQSNLGPQSCYTGIMPTLDDPYIYLDVDIDPNDPRKQSEISPILLELLKRFPTYTEVSPSGRGLHIVYKLNARDHETLKALKFTRSSSTSLSNPMTGELMFSSSFLIITEQPYFKEQFPINQISLENLVLFFPPLLNKLAQNGPSSRTADVIGLKSKQRLMQAPDIKDMRNRLMRLPAKMNYYVERAYQRLSIPMEPCTYDHWVNVCMCLAHAAVITQDELMAEEYYQLFEDWSKTDIEAYTGSEDTLAKWEQCLRSTAEKMQEGKYQPTLTKSTLHKLVNLCYPKYSVVTEKGVPVWEDTKNMEEVIRFHDLCFQADVYNFDSLYVECHPDVAERIFNETFTTHASGQGKVMVHMKDIDLSVRKILEASAYPAPTIGKCLKPFKGLSVQEVNFDINQNVHDKFKTFIDSVPWDGERRVEQVINTLTFDPHTAPEILEHYKTGLYKCLLWLVGVRYHNKPAAAPAVPILVGTEGIYKSTWVKSLLHGTPFELQYVKQVSGLMADRKELSRALQSTLIALIDEIEANLKNADKAKDILTEDTLSLRAHYTNNYVNVMKRGLLFGTTNNPYMNASDDGNRRMFRITVLNCDTDALWQIDMQQVYAELKQDYLAFKANGNLMPWVFTKEENRMNNIIMNGASTASEDSMLIHEYFGGTPEDFEFSVEELCGHNGGCKQNHILVDEGRATTVRKLTNDLVAYLQEQNFNMTVKAPNAAVIKRKLQNFSAKYTKTEHKTIMVGTCPLTNGILTSKKQQLFIVPVRKKEK